MVGQGFGQTVDDGLHHGLATHLVLAFDEGPVYFPGHAREGERETDETQGLAGAVFLMGAKTEGHDVDAAHGYGGDMIGCFQLMGVTAHGRDAAVSTGDADDYPVSMVIGNLLP